MNYCRRGVTAHAVRAKLLEEMREFPVLLCPVCAIPGVSPWGA